MQQPTLNVPEFKKILDTANRVTSCLMPTQDEIIKRTMDPDHGVGIAEVRKALAYMVEHGDIERTSEGRYKLKR